MSTLIGPEQVGERPQTPGELAEATKLAMLKAVNQNLILQSESLALSREMLAAVVHYEAEAWGLIMKKLRE